MKTEIVELLKFILSFPSSSCLCSYFNELKPYYEKLSEEDISRIKEVLRSMPYKSNPGSTEERMHNFNFSDYVICVYPDELVWAIMKANFK